MTDNSVDSIILEIESSTVQADKGLEKLGKALKNIQSATSGTDKIIAGLTTLKNAIDKMKIEEGVVNSLNSVSQSLNKLTTSIRETSLSNLKKELEDIESLSVGDNLEKLTTEHRDLSEEVKKSSNLNTTALTTVVNSLNGLHVDSNAGDNIKKIGSGFQSIANATSKVKSENIEALKEMGDVINKVSAGLGDLGKNNNVTIKIDANGIKNVVKPIDNVSESTQGLTKEAKKAETIAQQLKQAFSILNTDFSTGAHTSKEYAQSIKVLESVMKKVLNGKMELKDSDYEKLRIKIVELKERFKEFKEEASQSLRTTGVDNMSKSIQGIIDKQKEYSRVVSDMDSGKEGFDWKEYQKATVELEKLNGAMKAYQMVAKIGTPSGLNMLAEVCRKASEEMNKLAGIGLKVLRTIGSPFIALASVVKKQLSGITANFRDMSKNVRASLKKMSDFWKRTMKTFTFMVVRKAITAVIDNIKEAVDSLALWSKAMDTPFNESISNIVADFKYMARSILAAVEPLINAVAPLLNKLADMFSNLMSKVAQFFAALTGQSYYMKAKKNVKDYAASVDKASKKAKGALQSFDELNNITTNDNNADNPLSGFKDEWEKLPVDKKAKELADKLKAALADLWRPIGIAWDRMKDYVISGWKYMTGELKKLFKDVWDDFIEVWNQEATIKIFENIFGMIGDIEYAIGHLARNFRAAWNEADTGKHILENIRDIVGILVQHARNVTLYFRDWAAGLSFKPLLKSIEVLTNSLKRLADFIGGVFEDVMIMGVLKFIKWFTEEGLPKINLAIAHVLDTFDFTKIRKDIQPVIVAVEKLMEHLIGGITKAGENLGVKIAEWFNSDKFTKFTQAIAKFLNLFTEDRIAAVLEGIATAFLDIAAALADILSSKAVLSVFEGIGKVIDTLGAKGIATIIKLLAGAIAKLAVNATALTVLGTALSGIAKIKFAWDVASVARGLKNIGGTADGIKKAADSINAIKNAQSAASGAQTVAKGAQAAGSGANVAGEVISTSGAYSAGLTIGAEIIAGILAAIEGYHVGNKTGLLLSKIFNPDDVDLYEKYKIGGKGNLFKDLLGVGNKDESVSDNIKDMFNGIVEQATDFKNNPAIAWLTSSAIVAGTGPFASITASLIAFKAATKELDTDGIKENLINKFDEVKTKGTEAFNNVKDKVIEFGTETKGKLEPIISTIGHINFLIGNTLYAGLLSVMAVFKMVGDTMDGVLTKVAGAIDEKVIQPLEKIFETVDTKVVQPTVSKFEEMWSKVQEIFGYIMPFLEETVIIPLVGKIDESVTNIIEKFNSVWEKIQEIGGYVMPFLEDTIILPVVGVIDTAVTGIKDDFTLLWEDVKKGAKTAFGSIAGFIEKMMNGLITGLNVVVGALNKLGSGAADYLDKPWVDIEPFQKITIPKFEKGGFPEDGIFAANHNELVGQFSNGRTAVANNGQIIDGISNGVQQANAQQNVLFNQMIDLLGVIADKNLTIGDDAVFGAYQRGASRYGKRYGVGI